MSYRSDEEAAAYKRIADLEDENRRLRESAQKPRKEWKLPTVDFERAFTWVGLLALVAVCVWIGYALWQKTTSTGQIEFCYIRTYTKVNSTIEYDLMGYRSWQDDVEISEHDSVVNAYKAAEMLKCPLLKK